MYSRRSFLITLAAGVHNVTATDISFANAKNNPKLRPLHVLQLAKEHDIPKEATILYDHDKSLERTLHKAEMASLRDDPRFRQMLSDNLRKDERFFNAVQLYRIVDLKELKFDSAVPPEDRVIHHGYVQIAEAQQHGMSASLSIYSQQTSPDAGHRYHGVTYPTPPTVIITPRSYDADFPLSDEFIHGVMEHELSHVHVLLNGSMLGDVNMNNERWSIRSRVYSVFNESIAYKRQLHYVGKKPKTKGWIDTVNIVRPYVKNMLAATRYMEQQPVSPLEKKALDAARVNFDSALDVVKGI